ncbi:SymE family type I addiction module toxin [Fulvivirgaceae bacterium BMA12]|uniref:SymE family type I addiction module toxin n=1 Tax=Agaribacillus aureus TaxID=3051825 RepID=A0ABT8L498_9BACT|nr:SymE family type I addiction module toxin [Fulvivirgaceae bacterium BMA12]
MEKKIRKLKIHSRFRARTYDDISFPEIRLHGKWLDQLGFKEGLEVNIEQQPCKLTITLGQDEKE